MNSRVLSALSTAAMFAALAASAPASATVVERGSFTDEPYAFGYDCGFPVEVAGIGSGHFRLREGKNADASAFFSLDNISYQEIHTNPLTGRWFSVTGRFTSNEITATRVEGSLFEFRSIKAGPVATITDSAGNLVARDRGVLRSTILFDTGGDDVPGGEFVALLDLRLAGPHASFDHRCDVAAELIG
jgi:hypothetical protein